MRRSCQNKIRLFLTNESQERDRCTGDSAAIERMAHDIRGECVAELTLISDDDEVDFDPEACFIPP